MPYSEDDQMPWHLGVFDAHCHPTDTMSSVPSVRHMKARVLTIMATRSQDQQLVNDVCMGDTELLPTDLNSSQHTNSSCKILPAFGWHPWFSHQLFEDERFDNATQLSPSQKLEHYRNVLSPQPRSPEDDDFLASLPDAQSLGQYISRTRRRLQNHPLALVGEVGLDYSFRIPFAWDPSALDRRDDSLTPGGREGRRLSPFRPSQHHQRAVLLAQLRLAGELGRPVSVHGVQAAGALFQALSSTWKGHERPSKRQRRKDGRDAARAALPPADDGPADGQTSGGSGSGDGRPFPPRICLHSYSGHAQSVDQYLNERFPAEIFFSFSKAINFDGPSSNKAEEALLRVPDHMVLVESDLHVAGERMDRHLEDGVRKICQVKGWDLEQGVRILARNWHRFVFGEGPSEHRNDHVEP